MITTTELPTETTLLTVNPHFHVTEMSNLPLTALLLASRDNPTTVAAPVHTEISTFIKVIDNPEPTFNDEEFGKELVQFD